MALKHWYKNTYLCCNRSWKSAGSRIQKDNCPVCGRASHPIVTKEYIMSFEQWLSRNDIELWCKYMETGAYQEIGVEYDDWQERQFERYLESKRT